MGMWFNSIIKIYMVQISSWKRKLDFKKWAEDLNRTFSQRHIDGQQAHEEMMLNVTSHLGNANENHNETPPHTHQNACHHKDNK